MEGSVLALFKAGKGPYYLTWHSRLVQHHPFPEQQHSLTLQPLLAVPFTATAWGTPAHPSKPSSNITFSVKSHLYSPQQGHSFRKQFLRLSSVLGTETSEKNSIPALRDPIVFLVETDIHK